MKHGLLALAMAAAGLAAAIAIACAHAAPAPVTRPAIRQDAGNKPPPPGPAAGSAATHHSSEAEPKAQPVAAAAAAAPLPAAPPGAVTPLAPVVTASAAEAAAGGVDGTAGSSKPAAAPVVAQQAKAPGVAAAPTAVAPAATAGPVSAPGGTGAPAAAKASAGASPKSSDPSVIVVDTADYDPDSQLTLAEAAKAERERKADATKPRIVINNKNIHRYAKGGQLTVAEPKKQAAPPQPAQAAAAAAPAAASAVPLQRDEKYWRGRALEIRQRWRKASDRIKELEDDIALLRRRFYAQDDPYVRDGQIKPAWDRALDELRESRAAVQAAKKELTDFLEEGRIAGALPGWLREGVDLEPKEVKPVDPTQSIETPIYKDSGR
ncbi:MAG TPA: hypothetical protein VHG32_17550 [Thermoanaerobaculia bacterium]|jgi:hypothetical protein|nr:hypothetical protein [Thermoanaerobaculia bacterium]